MSFTIEAGGLYDNCVASKPIVSATKSNLGVVDHFHSKVFDFFLYVTLTSQMLNSTSSDSKLLSGSLLIVKVSNKSFAALIKNSMS